MREGRNGEEKLGGGRGGGGYEALVSKLLKTCYPWDQDRQSQYHKLYELKEVGENSFMDF